MNMYLGKRRVVHLLQHKEYKQRLAKDYRYAATKMQEAQHPARKLFYFSIFFAEAQRVLNLEWDRDIALIYQVTQQTHTQISTLTQTPNLLMSLPIDGQIIFEQLTKLSTDLASYFEKTEDDTNDKELYEILARLAEIAFIANGNGSYLYEKGLIKL